MQLRSLQSPSQASDQTVMAIAGHVSRQMLEHYSHVRLEAKRRAVEALSQRGDNGSYVTNNVTNGECGDIAQDATHRKDWSALAARGASLDSSDDKEVRNPQAEPIECAHGDEQAGQRGAARGDLDRTHGVGESAGASFL